MKATDQYQGKHVLVLGLAKSGYAAARLLHQLGAEVTVNDGKPLAENPAAQELIEQGLDVICGEHPLTLLDKPIDLIVKNPGIPYSNPILEEAVKRNIPIITEVELAYHISDADIVAITGSNGKTTTTTLITKMLENSGRTPLVAGNIGVVACEVAEQASDDDVIVMELSSFQLMGTDTFQPKISVLLNIFDAHLDYHGSKQHYIDAKARIQANQEESDYLVYNVDDKEVVAIAETSSATKIGFSTRVLHPEGLDIAEGHLRYKQTPIIALEDVMLPGRHNLENILAAVGASILAGSSREQIQHVLKTFGGVQHRLQFVKKHKERAFYNDSKATNILATSKALDAFQQPVILLAGGLDRGNSFDALIPSLSGVKAVVAFGETKHKIAETAQSVDVPSIQVVDVLEAAVHAAYAQSEEGDIILLSPACASWDQFRTFEERGDAFIQAVSKIIN
ncbi:UDP-N-acetylmuramoyl-L-alanine--D-glutamate ligase [Alkalicoccobacillus porphyridii]|uniref:UDP-N-acetylmuramoylalanine--D-glutamate ligase n=1 Tax=Alkalicoccobacillus porphyridii TaxID=2597270 RepID=A0A553ZY36_9BACI|nr:UDP-N-acetylmuramoyl-L-alanine--D-glutamate ligase [Alkalicoccobacillus porphyridii]TSB46325.1 UDP-N-acetylmuramoyl-L-alanine--D-glutamate ligase [Alkalicoccobacillus porphyridii]